MSRRGPGPVVAAVVAAAALAGGLTGCGGAAAAGSAAVRSSATTTAAVTSAPAGPTAASTSTSSPAGAPTTSGAPTAAVTGGSGASPRPAVTTTHALELQGPQPLPAAKQVVPSRVQIPAIGVDSALEHLRTVKGVLQPPKDPLTAGWWAGGPVPGDPGPAVIAGHLDSYTGPAVFIHLLDLRAGDVIYVTRSDGTRDSFTVDAVQTYEKSAFPTRAVYGTTPGSSLRLITCGGTFDRQKQLYLANVVVYASLTS